MFGRIMFLNHSTFKSWNYVEMSWPSKLESVVSIRSLKSQTSSIISINIIDGWEQVHRTFTIFYCWSKVWMIPLISNVSGSRWVLSIALLNNCSKTFPKWIKLCLANNFWSNSLKTLNINKIYLKGIERFYKRSKTRV